MLTNVTYPLQVARALLQLTSAPIGESRARQTMPTGSAPGQRLDFGARSCTADPWFTATYEAIAGEHVQLYYDLDSLYVEGFRVGNEGYTLNKGEGPGFMIAGGRVRDLGFGVSYGDLGLSRDTVLTLSPFELQQSLVAFRHFDFAKNRDAKFKMHVAKIVVGFAEGLRFRDIVLKICHSMPIQMKTDVDWNRRSKAGDPQVAVVKSN